MFVTVVDSPRVSGLSGAATPTQDSNHGDELRNLNPNLQGATNKKRRCRDFDGKFVYLIFKFERVILCCSHLLDSNFILLTLSLVFHELFLV